MPSSPKWRRSSPTQLSTGIGQAVSCRRPGAGGSGLPRRNWWRSMSLGVTCVLALPCPFRRPSVAGGQTPLTGTPFHHKYISLVRADRRGLRATDSPRSTRHSAPDCFPRKAGKSASGRSRCSSHRQSRSLITDHSLPARLTERCRLTPQAEVWVRGPFGDNAEADERGHGELRVLESTGSKQAIGASQVGVC